MKLTVNSLTLNCRGGVEYLEFNRQLNFFHGEMSAGKSSIGSLIDYCLGGRLERTPALASELVSVKMEAEIEQVTAVFERVLTDISNVQVSWKLPDETLQSASLPIKAGQSPVVDDDVFGLSDLILRFLDLPILKARKRTADADSDLVRLSFRDIAEFLYLEQPHLDSDFFLLALPIRMEKSKDALNFFAGYMSERLNHLQQQLQELRLQQRSMRDTAKRIEEFLRQFEFESVERLQGEIKSLEDQISSDEEELAHLKHGFAPETTVAEEDRQRMRALNQEVDSLSNANREINQRISEQEALIAELISLKFKLTRATSATALLEGVAFENCPVCGASTTSGETAIESCYLCKSPAASAHAAISAEIYRQDIDDRIDDLKQSVQRHKRALQRNENMLQNTRRNRSGLESALAQQAGDYETEYAARSRHYERRIAGAQERISLLERVKGMPRAVERIQRDADEISAELDKIRRQIEEEESHLSTAEENYRALERNYKKLLIAIGFPGVGEDDLVVINHRTLIPEIWTNGNEARKWTFFDAGSGGKKTLLKISFALALHQTAAERNLPVPHLLIIDSPMKNITPDINRDIFEHFYIQLYTLLSGPLKEWQCFVIDQSYFPPSETSLSFSERLMTRHDPDHPPLISYYDGP
ncbi:MAG: AAA family ATPase [Terracidiphilus sp.]|jgi:hypothetical protein